MKWKVKPRPRHGSIIWVLDFAFLPIKIGGYWYWLEPYWVELFFDSGNNTYVEIGVHRHKK